LTERDLNLSRRLFSRANLWNRP